MTVRSRHPSARKVQIIVDLSYVKIGTRHMNVGLPRTNAGLGRKNDRQDAANGHLPQIVVGLARKDAPLRLTIAPLSQTKAALLLANVRSTHMAVGLPTVDVRLPR
jgi:hypothetical protein